MKKKTMKKIIAALCTTGALAVPFSASAAPVNPANAQVQNPAALGNIIDNPFANDHHINLQVYDNVPTKKNMEFYILEHPWPHDAPGISMLEKDYRPACPYEEYELRQSYMKGFYDAQNHKDPVILEGNVSLESQIAYNEGYTVTLANHDAIHNLDHKTTFNDAHLQGIYDITYVQCTERIAWLDGNEQKDHRICAWEEVQDTYDHMYTEGHEEHEQDMEEDYAPHPEADA